MLFEQKMQYLIVQKFIFARPQKQIGGLHKLRLERQMFLLHNHALLFPEKLTKIWMYNGYIVR